jgi:hypothetical protein
MLSETIERDALVESDDAALGIVRRAGFSLRKRLLGLGKTATSGAAASARSIASSASACRLSPLSTTPFTNKIEPRCASSDARSRARSAAVNDS